MLLEQQIKLSQSILSVSEKKNKNSLPDEGLEQTIEYQQKQIKELTQKVEYYKQKSNNTQDTHNFDKLVYDTFNGNLKNRLKLIHSIHEWEKLENRVQGNAHLIKDSFHEHVILEDAELAHEHFNMS